MSRPATLRDAEAAVLEREKRKGLIDRVYSLLQDGWGVETLRQVLARRGVLVDLPSAYAEELNPYHHGVEVPTSDRKSRRVRRDVTQSCDWSHYYQDC